MDTEGRFKKKQFTHLVLRNEILFNKDSHNRLRKKTHIIIQLFTLPPRPNGANGIY